MRSVTSAQEKVPVKTALSYRRNQTPINGYTSKTFISTASESATVFRFCNQLNGFVKYIISISPDVLSLLQHLRQLSEFTSLPENPKKFRWGQSNVTLALPQSGQSCMHPVEAEAPFAGRYGRRYGVVAQVAQAAL